MIQELPYNGFKFEMSKTEYDHYSKELKSIDEDNLDKFENLIYKTVELNNYNVERLRKNRFCLNKMFTERVNPQIGKIINVFDTNKVRKLVKSGELKRDMDIYINNFDYFHENMSYKEFKNYCKKLNEKGRGCVLEVDLEYPDELHDSHDDFALCPEVPKINEMKYFKLICNTFYKEKYRIHYKMLLFVLEHGLKLKEIREIVSFNEKKWLEPYIMKNTNLRKQAENAFEKDFYKLMNNAEFGKTMEDVRKYGDFRLEFDEKKIQKLIDNPRYKRGKIINNDLVQIEMRQTNSHWV
jgi:hypothetical protein